MKLKGYDSIAIRTMGIWAPNSNTFIEYIQYQLSTFTTRMVAQMKKVKVLTNMERGVTREDL